MCILYLYVLIYSLILITSLTHNIHYWTSPQNPINIFKINQYSIKNIMYIFQYILLAGLPPISLFWVKLLILNIIFNAMPLLIYFFLIIFFLILIYFYVKYIQILTPFKWNFLINKGRFNNSIVSFKVWYKFIIIIYITNIFFFFFF